MPHQEPDSKEMKGYLHMSNVQWQLNDALSVYEPERANVFMGFKNVDTPGWSTFRDAFETFGKNLVQRGDLLTPMEMFKLKSGGNLQTIIVAPILSRAGSIQYMPLPEGMSTLDIENSQNRTISGLGVMTVYKVVYDRLQVGSQITDFVNRETRNMFGFGAAFSPSQTLTTLNTYFDRGVPLRDQRPDIQKTILDLAQKASLELSKTFDARFLPKFRGFLDKMMTDQTTPSAIRRRWKTSNFMAGNPNTVETGMQLNVTAALPQSRDVNPNVFSRTGEGTQADKELEMVTAAFCRVLIQDPAAPSPARNLPDHVRTEMIQKGVSSFYPRLNYSAVPSNYGLTPSGANRRLSLLQVVRDLCVFVGIAQGFGQRRALSRAYEEGGVGVQRMIINAIYPFRPGAQLYDYSSRRYENYIFTSNNHRYVCPTTGFVATMFLMDYLNTDKRLRMHTVNYLAWVRSKCESAVSLQQMLQSGNLPRIGTQVSLLRPLPVINQPPVNFNLFNRFITPTGSEPGQEEMIDSGVFIPFLARVQTAQ